ncbi:hypothetical protein ACHAPU_007486 [Fusarium lateritium]
MSNHTRSQNVSLPKHEHDSLDDEGHIPRLIVDLRALRILLEVTAVGQATENDAATEVDSTADQSTQQSIQQQPFASQSTDLSSPDAVNVEVSTVYTPDDEAESDIYTDHHVGGRPQKSAFQMRIEQVSKTRLSAFTSSALSFLTQTGTGHIVCNQEPSGGQPPISDQQKDSDTAGSVTKGTMNVTSCNSPESSPSDWSMTATEGVPETSTILQDEEEEDLISFDVTPSYDYCHFTPQASDSPEKTDVPETHAVPTVEPVAALEDSPSAEAMSMVETRQLSMSRPESEAAGACSKCRNDCDITKCLCGHVYCRRCLYSMIAACVRGETSFPPTCCGHLVPVDANSSTFDRKILQDFLVKKYGVVSKTSDLALCKPRFGSAAFPPMKDTLRDQLAKYMESSGKKLCHLCKKAIDKDAACPDCCYRCNNPRGSCKCPWWKERQLKHSDTEIAFRVYNPKAPAFRPTISQPGPQQIIRQARPFGGMFPSQNQISGTQLRGIHCRHVEMKKMGKPGPCFDCKVKLPGGGWYCLQCHYLLCEKCKVIRHG